MSSPPQVVPILGFYIAIATTLLTIITFGIAFLTPPLSGPSCMDSCYEYPYHDIASRFPRDYYWMYPAMILTLLFVMLMVVIHHYAADNRKVFSQIGLSFGLIAAAALIVDYFVQVSVIPPSLENGETEGIALLTQFNPHGVFIALEEVGYLMMSLAFLSIAPVFTGGRLERAIRWIYIGSFVLSMIALISVSIMYSIEREYRFEIAAITLDWATLIITGPLLAALFRRGMKPQGVQM
jgi:hypothetical protein